MRNQPFSQLTADWVESTSTVDHSRRRPLILAALIVLLQLPIMARLVHIQAFVGERFITPWKTPAIELETVPARDGRIVSRDGVVFAQDEVEYDISVDYRWLETPMNASWLRRQAMKELSSKDRKNPERRKEIEQQLLAHQTELLASLEAVTGASSQVMAQRMSEIQKRIETMRASVEQRRFQKAEAAAAEEFQWSDGLTGVARLVVDELTTSPDRFADDPLILKEELQDHVVLKNVPLQVVATIQSQPARFRGVQIRSNSSRHYPRQTLASHVVGVRRHVADDNDSSGVRKGEAGVEKSHQAVLQGIPGETKRIRDRHGELVESEVLRLPQDGQDVVLTIDSQLQQLAEQALDRVLYPPPQSLSAGGVIPRGACLVAMDVWTGDILALANSPRPSLPVLARPTVEEWERLQRDPGMPLFSRATQMALPPGALFKLITATAALESGITAPGEILHCQGFLDQPDRYRCLLFRQQGIGHGQLLLDEAISQSCQVCFHDFARRMGPESLLGWATRFGLGQPTGIDLPSETSGKLPSLASLVAQSSNGRQRVTGETLQLGVGQGAVLVSPLQVARVMAAIANGGYLVTPHVAKVDEDELAQLAPQRIPGLSAASISLLRRGLEQSVQSENGNARGAQVDLLPMAALCGTGTVGEKADHAWIAGYAPAQNPRVAVVVVLEHGGAGENAAPVFRDFVLELLGMGELRPPVVTPPAAAPVSSPGAPPDPL
ncbi:peptidoglycan D,D-transpeptidase FtsI family protein [Planctomicrobium sp. SH527]|uniref:peptidoglycan D,D-transpeptidase FtsI family protein n=1 Tax=Planctomicrobium sp. SH527 TaxID=3448123 RepID=UPI003F5C1A2E